jgi:hypothetical protein
MQGPEHAAEDGFGGWLEKANGSARPGLTVAWVRTSRYGKRETADKAKSGRSAGLNIDQRTSATRNSRPG